MLVPSRVFRPSIEPLAPASSSPRGSCCATPSPQLTSPGGHDQGRFARPASFLQARRKWGYREPPEKTSRVLDSRLTPRGSRTSRAAGRGVPLASREAPRPRIPLASELGAKWSVRFLGAAALTRWARGTEHSSRRTVAQPAPRFAIRPRMGRGGARPVSTHSGPRKGRRGSGGPRQLPGGARHGAVPRPGLAAAGRHLPSGPVARPGRGRSRRGLVPEGDRSRARSRPPAGPATARCRPVAPAPPRRPHVGPGEGPRIPQAVSGAAGDRRAPALARPLLPGFPAHLRHIGTFRANEQRRAQSPDGAPEPIAAAAAAAAVRPAPARRRRRLGPL